jgi:hypothetical protein
MEKKRKTVFDADVSSAAKHRSAIEQISMPDYEERSTLFPLYANIDRERQKVDGHRSRVGCFTKF